ncbi:Toxin CptA [Sodalis glossinidius str. 'morsitans']|nr:Toxin CptA [Sodalis glossinidius str. 'morsitans']
MLILLSPWPENYGLVWLTLVLVVVFECIRSQRNIMSCRGELVLMSDNSIQWHREEWIFTRKACMLKGGAVLSLRKVGGKRRRRLWLAADSMDGREFRHLRQLLARQAGS